MFVKKQSISSYDDVVLVIFIFVLIFSGIRLRFVLVIGD